MLLLLLACTEPSRSTRDGAVDVPDCVATPADEACDTASAQNVMFTWAKSVCGLLLDCCTKTDRAATASLLVGASQLPLLLTKEPAMLEEPRACQRAIALGLFLKYQQHYQSKDDGRQRFNRENARTCLDGFALGASHCAPGLVLVDDAHLSTACRHLFEPVVSSGSTCRANDDCLDAPDGGRSVCQPSSEQLADGGIFFSLNGVCHPLPSLGESCPLPDGECGAEAFCAADKTCHARGHIDDVCIAAPCDSENWCDTTKPLPACAPRRGNFGPCASDAECRPETQCHLPLGICLARVNPDPLDVKFDFCLGTDGVAVARTLVPDGGP